MVQRLLTDFWCSSPKTRHAAFSRARPQFPLSLEFLQMSELWNPWEISERSFPRKGKPSDKLRFLLNYAILAPSGHNSQPWLFKITVDRVELYADRTRALPVCDPQDRELVMACGAALFNLRIAFRHFSYEGRVQTFAEGDDPDLLARISFGGKRRPRAEDELLFRAIPERHTNRKSFEKRPVPGKILSELQTTASKEGAWLHLVESEEDRKALADLVAEGDQIQMADPSFRRELAAWMHPNRAMTHEGMPGFSQGLGDLRSSIAPIVVRTFDVGKGQAAKDRELATGSPVLAVLGTDEDTEANWLSAGQALERLLLRARAEGVWASFLNQPIEVSVLRSRLGERLQLRGFPQLILRMGYGPQVKPTPRRTPGEVLMRPLR